MTDLTGVRVIVYYNDDVDAISRLIVEEFDVDRANSMDKRQTLEPQEFGYQSVHYVVHIPSSRSGLTEWRRFTALRAEIQVRTVLQHAWAAISHKLAYKREADIPSALQRKLFRLSALLELGDDEFASLRDQTHALSQEINLQIEQGKPDISLDLVSLREYLAAASETTTLVTYVEQAGFGISEPLDTGQDFSDLLRILRAVGVTTVGGLKSVLQRSQSWAKQYFKRLMEEYKTIKHPEAPASWEASPSFFVLLLVIGHFKHMLSVSDLVAMNWGEESAKLLMRVVTGIDTDTKAS
jgi:Uncharacterized protein conserved in bacteria